ncbi:MAG: uncharacterized protein QOF45_1705 [Gaiellaceae bacterium]|jgi:uncharacterized membrane protein YczE|nr:uncharacterized protein [Gaiellaceae bacterium]
MHAPPVLRGGVGARYAGLVFGLFLCAAGVVGLLESRLGLSPWDVLHQGLAQHSPLSFGTANVAVGLVVLVLSWRLGARIGPGTVANAILIGLFIAVLVRVPAVDALSEEGLAVRTVLLVAGIGLVAVGSAFYLGAAFGAGPRDSLMLVLALRTGWRIGLVRTLLESSVVVVGALLGGTIGVGTIAFALLIGPALEASFWLLVRTPLAGPAVASAPA